MKKIVISILMLILITSFVSAENINFSQVLKVSHSMGPNGPDYYGVGPQQVTICNGEASSWNGTKFICITSGGGFSNGSDITVRDLNITRNGWLNGSRICTPGNAFCGNTTINNITNNITNNIYLSSATGAGVATAMTRWVNTTHLNASNILYDTSGAIGIGDSTPTESRAKLIVSGAESGPFNATFFKHTTATYNMDVNMLFGPGGGTNPPAIFRTYFTDGATIRDTNFGFVVTNTTSHQRQLLTIDGYSSTVSVGDTSNSDSAFKVQNVYNKNYPLLITGVSDNLLFRVNESGLISFGTTGKVGIGTGTGANTNEVKLQVQGGTTGQPFNASLLYNPSTNHGGEVKLLFSPSVYNINRPSYIRSYFAGALVESLFGFVVTNSTSEKQLLTIDGNYGVGIGDATLSTDNAAFKIQNTYNRNYPVLVTDASDNLLFRVNNSGAIAFSTNAKVGIGTGTTANINNAILEIKGGVTGQSVNWTQFHHPSVNFGSEGRILMSPSTYNIAKPTYIRSYFIGAVGDGEIGFVVTNRTSAELQLLTISGYYESVGIGDLSPDSFLKVQNIYSKTNALRVTNAADSLLFNVDSSGNTTVGTTLYVKNNGRVGIGETTPGATLSVSGGATIGSGIDTATPPTNGLIVQGLLNATGTIQASGYVSSDGTAGFTGSCASTTTLTVKNGLITGCA